MGSHWIYLPGLVSTTVIMGLIITGEIVILRTGTSIETRTHKRITRTVNYFAGVFRIKVSLIQGIGLGV